MAYTAFLKFLNRILTWAGNSIAVLMLLLMALIPCVEFIGRRFFGFGISGATDYLQHLTLWLCLFGAILAVRDKKHLSIVGALDWLPKPMRVFAVYWSPFIAASVCWSLCGASIQLIVAEAPAISVETGQMLPSFIVNWLGPFGLFDAGAASAMGGWIPRWVAESIMPIGFAGIAISYIFCFAKKRIWPKLIIALSLPLVIALSIIFPMPPTNLIYLGFAVLLVSVVFGAPIFVFLGGAALLLFWADGVTTAAIPTEMYRIVVSPVFPTIPLFTLAGFLLSESKSSERFVKVFQSLFGWFPGGTAVAITLLCAFFTTFTGASGITILALGGLLLPVLRGSGSSERFSVGLLTATGSIGLLFPPSLVVILFAVIAQVSIIDMFKAGIVPGALMVLPICFMCIWDGRKNRKDAAKIPFEIKKVLSAIWQAKWELMIPVVALVGIFGGFCTMVEAAALTVMYTLIIETCVYRDLDFRKLFMLLVNCAVLVGGVLIVLGVAMGLTSYLVDAEIPARAAEWAVLHLDSRWKFLLLLNLALILVGCMMDIYSALIVVVPLILPMAEAFGISPIHLGIIFLVNLQLGYLTPPVGMNLFLAAFRFDKSLMRVARYAIPFLLILLVVVVLVTYVPWLSIGILNLLK